MICLILDPFIDFALLTDMTSSSSLPILAKLHTAQTHLRPLFSSVGSGPAKAELFFGDGRRGGLFDDGHAAVKQNRHCKSKRKPHHLLFLESAQNSVVT